MNNLGKLITVALCALLVIAIAFSFGCKDTEAVNVENDKEQGESDSIAKDNGEEDNGANEEVVTLRYPHWFFEGGNSFEEWIDGVVEEFEKQNPNIDIDGYPVSFEVYLEKLETAVAAGDAPDIMTINPATLGKFIPIGALLPLDDLIDMSDVRENFGSLQNKEVVAADPGGKTYLLTTWSNIYLPMYRPSVFEEAGIDKYAESPEEFIEMCKKLTSGDRYGYAATLNPGNWQEALYELTIWTYGLGGRWSKDGLPNLDSPEVVKAMEYLKMLYDANVIPKETDKGTYRQMFATGKVGTIIDGPFLYPLCVGWDPTIEGDYEVVDLPFPTQDVTAIFWGSSIYSGTQHPEEAAKFVEFVSSRENHSKLIELTGVMASRTDISKDQDFMNRLLGKYPYFEKFLDHTNNAVLQMPPDMAPDKISEVNQIWWTYGEKIIFENADAEETMIAAQNEAMKLFE